MADSSILIDVLRSRSAARALWLDVLVRGPIEASEITRLEVLAGMRRGEERRTLALLDDLVWHPVDEAVAVRAGELGRRWPPSHGGIDAADLAIAATAQLLGARLLTRNVRHFPMFEGLAAPY